MGIEPIVRTPISRLALPPANPRPGLSPPLKLVWAAPNGIQHYDRLTASDLQAMRTTHLRTMVRGLRSLPDRPFPGKVHLAKKQELLAWLAETYKLDLSV